MPLDPVGFGGLWAIAALLDVLVPGTPGLTCVDFEYFAIDVRPGTYNLPASGS